MKPFLFISSILLSFQAFAKEAALVANASIQKGFYEEATRYTAALQGQGYSTVEGVHLKIFHSQLKDIRWSVLMNGFVDSGDGRYNAVNYPKKKWIIISEPGWNQIPERETKYALALHEALMVLGYRDHNYAISLGIKNAFTSLANGASPAAVSALASMSGGGGVTGVGSGGNGMAMQLKQILLLQLICTSAGSNKRFEKMGQTCESMRRLIMQANFEMVSFYQIFGNSKPVTFRDPFEYFHVSYKNNQLQVRFLDALSSVYMQVPEQVFAKVIEGMRP